MHRVKLTRKNKKKTNILLGLHPALNIAFIIFTQQKSINVSFPLVIAGTIKLYFSDFYLKTAMT